MVEVNPNGNLNNDTDDGSDVEELEAQLNEIESALDNLESQNDNIHSKLKELLESNREFRKEMASLGIVNKKDAEGSSNASQVSSDVSQLQQMHSLSMNNQGAGSQSKANANAEQSSARSKK